MRRATAGFALSLMLVASTQAALAQEDRYLPQEGDEVVVYTHRFHAEDWDEASRMVSEGFHDAMTESGQTRRTYFLVDPSAYEILAISFFGPNESVEAWQEFASRVDVLEALEPMRREPLDLQRYTVLSVSETQSEAP